VAHIPLYRDPVGSLLSRRVLPQLARFTAGRTTSGPGAAARG
jgi:hypothetical protein